jgi:hypothetical protein
VDDFAGRGPGVVQGITQLGRGGPYEEHRRAVGAFPAAGQPVRAAVGAQGLVTLLQDLADDRHDSVDNPLVADLDGRSVAILRRLDRALDAPSQYSTLCLGACHPGGHVVRLNDVGEELAPQRVDLVGPEDAGGSIRGRGHARMAGRPCCARRRFWARSWAACQASG